MLTPPKDGEFKTHGCAYRFHGETYFLTVPARSAKEAKSRLRAALMNGEFDDGCVLGSAPGFVPRWLLVAWLNLVTGAANLRQRVARWLA